MRRHRRCSRRALGAFALALAVSGCGGSSGPRAVQVSLIAPTNGATVLVSRLYVTGSVQPADAKVVVAGRAVRNHDGRFGRWIPLRPGVTHIRIAARAPGYIGDTTEVAVRRAPASPARKQQAAQQLAPSIAGLSTSTWTPEVRARMTTGCEVNGGWPSYCECVLRYAIASGSPLQVATSFETVSSQRRLPGWIKQAIVHCL